MNRELKLKRYKSLDEILLASIGDETLTLETLGECTMGGVTEDGDEMDLTMEQTRECIEEQGIWGFVDEKNTIHVWIKDQNVRPVEIIGFFAHEIGHKVGKPHKDEYREELRADLYREVAELAFLMAEEIYPNKEEEGHESTL